MADSRSAEPRRPKVVRVIARLNVGGPARHVTILHEGLPSEGFESILVHGTHGADEASFERLLADRGLRAVQLPSLGRRITAAGDLTAFWALLQLVFREQPDIIHTHTAKAGTLGRLAGVVFNLTRLGRRKSLLVHTFHGHVLEGYFGPVGNAAVRLAERSLALVSDAILTISPSQRDDIVRRFRVAPERKVAVIPLGLDLDELLHAPAPTPELREHYGFAAGDFVVGFVGRLAPIKDLPTLVHGFAAFAAGRPRARLLIVGDGQQRAEIEALLRRLGVDRSARFAGWQQDLRGVYGAMDVLALTSRNEGTPVAVIEALASGVPVVATSVGGVADVVRHEETGLLIASGDSGALASALACLEAEPALRYRLGARGRAEVAERFAHTRLVRDVAACYRELLDRRNAS